MLESGPWQQVGEGIRVLSSTFYLCLEGANTPRLPEAGEGGGEERPGRLHQVSPQFPLLRPHNILAKTGSLVLYFERYSDWIWETETPLCWKESRNYPFGIIISPIIFSIISGFSCQPYCLQYGVTGYILPLVYNSVYSMYTNHL